MFLTGFFVNLLFGFVISLVILIAAHMAEFINLENYRPLALIAITFVMSIIINIAGLRLALLKDSRSQ